MPPARQRRRLTFWQILGRAIAVLSALGITVAIVLLAPKIQEYRSTGYFAVFLISLIANATIILPVPALAVTFSMGATLHWPLVGLVAGIGEALGESTGYLAGYGGRAVIENRQLYTRMQYWMENHGMLTVFGLSAIPNPLIDLAGITAGASGYGFHKFLFAAWLGKTLKTMIFAWAGTQSISWLSWFLLG
ncbi:MAG: VTT domain-containing protein [Anaerolineae bacterium]|nr:VTT domain-containing protein [Anaerolineae bacterium]